MRAAKLAALGLLLLAVLPSLLTFGSMFGVVLLLVAVGIAVGLRPGTFGGTALQTRFTVSIGGGPDRPPLEAAADFDAFRRRMAVGRHALAAAFPADPLGSEALVQVLGAYVNEPEDERRRVSDEYQRMRARFLTWAQEVDRRQGSSTLDTAEETRLETELGQLQGYVDSLRARAEAAETAVESALEASGRAEAALESARAAWGRLDPNHADPDLKAALDAAAAKLHAIRGCFEEGRERPMTASRLAEEIIATATDVQEKAAAAVDLPTTLDDGSREVAEASAEAERELERLRGRIHEARALHPAHRCDDVEALLTAAGAALGRARSYTESVDRRLAADALEEGASDLAEARASLEHGSELLRAAAEHVKRLEDAALNGRGRVVEAEKAVDRAAAESGSAERVEAVRRATDLVARAREELDRDQPDWLSAVELADRGVELVRAVESSGVTRAAVGPGRSLADARASAEAARESALAWRLVAFGASGADTLLLTVEEAFRRAADLAVAADAASTAGERERAVAAATEAFEAAERAANDVIGETVANRSGLAGKAGSRSVEITVRRFGL